MLEALFWGITALAFTLIFLGYYAKESAYSLVGWGLIFIMSAWVLATGSLQYPDGNSITTSYTYTNSTLTQTIETTTPTYTNYANDNSMRFWAFWLTLIAGIGIYISTTDVKRFIR